MKTILLLDMDGTLIHDRGYRRAMILGSQWICNERALPTFTPTEDEINIMHSCGYSNEWDSIPFTVGINLLHKTMNDAQRPDFGAWARRSTEYLGQPNERARDLLLGASPTSIHSEIHELLDDVKDPITCKTTRVLYEFVLGSDLFTRHYGLEPIVDTPSLLETLDESALNDEGKSVIAQYQSTTYTARPSLPPDDSKPGIYQTPEAEIGLKLIGLEHLTNIGLGPMQWLAQMHNASIWDFAKPATTQSLCAMLAASGVSIANAAMSAYQFTHQYRANEEVCALDGAQVCVFEDNAGGVRAVHEMAQQLMLRGINITVRGYGIARDEAKRKALSNVCEGVFDDVNTALATLCGT
jgi:hypothetical protein